ncbi:MAG: PilZ domain-containing protein [Acidobacteriota bacterium]
MRTSGLLTSPARPKAGTTGKLISAYYLEVEYLLERIEGAANHYQALGLERTANHEEAMEAYQQAVSVLHPSYHKVRAALPDEIMVRVDKAFKQVSGSFGVLASPKKRLDYDRSLKRSVRTPLSIEVPSELPRPPTPPADIRATQSGTDASPAINHDRGAVADAIDIRTDTGQQPIFTKITDKSAVENRRRCERFKLTVPALLAGYDHENKRWQEVAKTVDVGRMGVAVRMHRKVRSGSVVHITLPLPTKLRNHGFSDQGYNMYVIVRRIEPVSEELRLVGLEFIGNHPPAGYLNKPWATFRTQKWTGPNRRREGRVDHIEPVVIEYLDENKQPIRQDSAVTENISLGGARVCTRSTPPEFEFLRIAKIDNSFESLALVRNQYTGKDGYERLCLQLVDQKWPF